MLHSPSAQTVLPARIPVSLEVPPAMQAAVAEVLAGEYESGYSGHGLRILDLGANVGAFTLWAHARWPNSTIDAYEPHPGTFAILQRNVAHLPRVRLHNSAVYPSARRQLPFFTRFDGDGESGLAECMEQTFDEASASLMVNVLHPTDLPAADIVKLDVEGAEAEILQHANLAETSLILLEYQNDRARQAIKQYVARDFDQVFEDEFPWDDLLDEPGYRQDLAGDHWGRLFYVRRKTTRVWKTAEPRSLGQSPDRPEPPPSEGHGHWWQRFRRRLPLIGARP